MKKNLLFCIALLLLSLFANTQTYNGPESVVYDATANRYLISNINSGQILQRNSAGVLNYFVQTGLTSPKGLVIKGDVVYATDITRVVGYKLSTAELVFNVSIAGSSSLNDIEADNAGFLYMSDFNASRIYKLNIATQVYSVFANTPLASPNGLLLDAPNNRLLLCSFVSNCPIQGIDLVTGNISTVANTSIGFLDGLTRDLAGDIYVSGWGASAVYKFNSNFSAPPTIVQAGFQGPGDIYYDGVNQVLAVPQLNGNVVTFIPITSCTAGTLTTQPSNSNTCAGTTATFTVATNATGPLYQWQVSTNGGGSFSNIAGATSATLNISNVTAGMNNNQYRCAITGTCNTGMNSNAAVLTVTENTSISVQPLPATACSGTNTSFVVSTTGGSPSYQWQVSTDGGTTFNDISGATNATLNLTAVTTTMNGNRYRCRVNTTCPDNLISASALLTVTATATITTQPSNQGGCAGASVTFMIAASGPGISYQWQESINGGSSFNNITGETSSSLILNNITAGMNNNQYRCVISNSCTPSLNSAAALLTVSGLVAVTAQPAPITVCEGTNTSFGVTISGGTFPHQWQVSTDNGANYTNVAGATSPTLNLTNVTAAMNGNRYRCVISADCPGSITTSSALLTVTALATITTQPANQTACDGSTATFTIAVSGPAISYQWQESSNGGSSFSNIGGATTASLTLNNITTAMNSNQYRCVISNSCTPAFNSAAGTLTVTSLSSITTHPAPATVCEATNTSFTVAATGGTLTYQWQVSTNNGSSYTNIANATSATLNLNAVTNAMNGNLYHCVITSSCSGVLTSNNALLTVTPNVVIATQPASQSSCAGSSVTFTVSATGSSLSYQWQVSTNGGTTFSDISGAILSSYAVSGITAGMNNNRYKCIIGSICPGITHSNAATLTVDPAPAITFHPLDVSVCSGATATFAVIATGVNLTYQWQVSTDGGANFSNIAGATLAAVDVITTPGMNTNRYRCVVSGNCSAPQNSNAATLTINPSPQVTLTASPYTKLFPGLETTLTATISSGGATHFTWYKDNVVVPGVGSPAYTIGIDGLGTYKVTVRNANGCSNTSGDLVIGDSINAKVFIYPNPSNGIFQVRHYTTSGVSPGTISIYNAVGKLVHQQVYSITGSSAGLMVDMSRNRQAGIYIIILTDSRGNTISSSKIMISH